MYPQLTGEPNFILIGVAAVFGLIIIVLMYYSISFKKSISKQARTVLVKLFYRVIPDPLNL